MGQQIPKPYDVKLTLGSTVVGLILAEREGMKQWRVQEVPFLSPQYFNVEADYRNIPPEQRLMVTQQHFDGGMGLQDFTWGDRGFYNAYGVDCRFSHPILGPKKVATTVPAYPATLPAQLLNNSFEDWGATDPTSWTFVQVTGVTTRGPETTTIQEGATAAKLTGDAAGASSAQWFQDLTWEAAFQGKTFTVWGWCYRSASTVTGVKVGIDDGETITWSSELDLTAIWKRLYVSKTLDAALSNRLRVIVEASLPAAAYSAIFDTVSIQPNSAAATAFKGFCIYNSNLYLARGVQLLKWNTSTLVWDLLQQMPVSILDMEAYGNNLYIALNSDAYVYYDGTTFTQSNLTGADRLAEFWCAIVGSKLWKAIKPNSVYSNPNPVNDGAAWSTATLVDSAGYDITDLVWHDINLFVAKENGIFYPDSAGTIQEILRELRSLEDSAFGVNAISWKDLLYFPAGSNALYEYDPAAVRSVSRYVKGQADFVGRVLALAGDAEWMYAFIDNDTKVELLAGRTETIAGASAWRWYPVAEVAIATIAHALISTAGTTTSRLWYCASAHDGEVGYFYLPKDYGDVFGDTTYAFALTGNVTTADYDSNFIDEDKAYFALSVYGNGLTVDQYITAEYSVDGGAWVTIGSYKARGAIDFPANVSGKKIKFRFTFTTTVDTATPELVSFAVLGILRPPRVRRWEFSVRCADGIILRTGAPDPQLASTISAGLEAMRTSVTPCSLEDIDGASYNIEIIEKEEFFVIHEKSKLPERHFRLVALEV